MEPEQISSLNFKIVQVIIFLFGIFIITKLTQFAKMDANPNASESKSFKVFRYVIGSFFFVSFLGNVFVYLYFWNHYDVLSTGIYPLDLNPYYDSNNFYTVIQSKMNLVAQTIGLSYGMASYFFCFRWSNSTWWQKILKIFIVFILIIINCCNTEVVLIVVAMFSYLVFYVLCTFAYRHKSAQNNIHNTAADKIVPIKDNDLTTLETGLSVEEKTCQNEKSLVKLGNYINKKDDSKGLYCSYCGKPINYNAGRFCKYCGKEIK